MEWISLGSSPTTAGSDYQSVVLDCSAIAFLPHPRVGLATLRSRQASYKVELVSLDLAGHGKQNIHLHMSMKDWAETLLSRILH
ncbi:zinc finger, RING-type [Musa troglodytarum]|uniref:Zinc finger, RING-type n=1 Tax=Musa troglodytarum TaxID=320322 RepID=A0A9E7L8F1_9LILI|nr:zinc finger, RING-type [Musa troglodytarum]